MKIRCSRGTLAIALHLLSAAFPLVCGQTVRGIEGQSVTLPCSYKVRKPGDITTMCWGRGSCPNSKCNDLLIWTDGHRVTERSSERYQLNDNIPGGRISLTISQASMSDAGTYCCRIEHHGWFNDEKINIRLNMERAPTTTPPTTTRRTTPRTTPPPAKKTTLPPTTTKATTPPPTTIRTTTPPTTTEMVSTPPPMPATTTTMTPTEEEPQETTEVPTAENTTPEGATLEPVVTTTEPPPPLTTVLDTPYPCSTSMGEPHSTEPCEHCNEISPAHEESNPHQSRSTLPPEYENGISDLFSGNSSTVVEKDNGLPIHIIITAVCLSIIILIVITVLVLRFRGKERGRYLFGFDTNLELVSHAEVPLPETDAEISQTVTLEVDKMEASQPTL